VTYLLATIGTRDTTEGEVEAVIEHHLRHPAFWSAIRHDSWAKGSGVVVKMTGVGLLVLAGVLDCSAPAHDPLEVGGQIREWRYAMRWDRRPRRTVPVGELGVPFDQALRLGIRHLQRALMVREGSLGAFYPENSGALSGVRRAVTASTQPVSP
jgi:hypothetical protein